MQRIHEKDEFKALINILDFGKIDYTIAGGYPRDIYHGKEPRDMDIIVICAESTIKKLISTLEVTGFQFKLHSNEDSGFSEEKDEYGDPYLSCVIKLNFGVDLVFLKEDIFPSSNDVVVHYFDFNINQFILKFELGRNLSESSAGGRYVPKFVGKNQGNLCLLLNHIGEDRVKYIQEKAKNYGWVV